MFVKNQGASLVLATGALVGCGLAVLPASAQSFTGAWEFRWLSEPNSRHRVMETLSPDSFVDAAGKLWSVPAGTPIDGASIPEVLWSFAGSPFVGNYRRASVIHDYYCVAKTELNGDVHRMFREAMLADGVGWIEAGIKYLAVAAYNFAGKGCGKAAALVTAFSAARNSFSTSELGVEITDEFLSSVQQWADQPVLDVDGLRTRIGDVNRTAQVANPRTLAAMAAFRLDPSEDNLAALEDAFAAEQPSNLEQEMLVLTTQASVPARSVLVLPDLPGRLSPGELAPPADR